MAMVLEMRSSLVGQVPGTTRAYEIRAGDIVRWHCDKEAQRLVDKGYARLLTGGNASDLVLGGKTVVDHPLMGHVAKGGGK